MENKVELLGFYGGDIEHAQSAWTSTQRELSEEKINRIPQLLKYLAEAGHHTPFEKSTLHFLITSEIATHIHFLKHRINVSINAESSRYKELRDDKFYLPPDWSERSKNQLERHMLHSLELYHSELKILTSEYLDKYFNFTFEQYKSTTNNIGELKEIESAWVKMSESKSISNNLTEITLREIVLGVIPEEWDEILKKVTVLCRKRAKESARFYLPYANQITYDISFNWRSFAHFLSLRYKADAQFEIRELAGQMLELVKNIEGNPFKHTINAFKY